MIAIPKHALRTALQHFEDSLLDERVWEFGCHALERSNPRKWGRQILEVKLDPEKKPSATAALARTVPAAGCR